MTPYVSYALTGLAAGFVSKLLGVGGGVVMVPVLYIFLTMDLRRAIGTSLAFIFPVALVGAFQDGLKHYVDYRVVLFALPLGLLGTVLGSWVGDRMETRTLTVLFGSLMVLVGLKMVFFPGGWQELKARAAGTRPAAVEVADGGRSDDGAARNGF